MLRTLTIRTRLRGPIPQSPITQFPRVLLAGLQPTSKPIQWRSIAPLATVATADPSISPRIPRKTYEWTPDLDSKLIQLRDDNVSWKRVEKVVGIPYIRCKERYRHIAEVRQPETWSMDIEKSTRHEKSLTELNRLIEEGKSWSEIAGIMSTEVVICQRQWAGLGKRFFPGPAGTFQGTMFSNMLESGQYKLKNRQGGTAAETEGSSTKKSPSEPLLDVELYDWEKMSEEIYDHKFSPEYLRYRYVSKSRIQSSWSEEDRLALSEYFKKSTPHLGSLAIVPDPEPNWHSVSRDVVQRRHSPFECRWQWLKTKKKNRQIKEYPPWTAAEILEYWDVWNKEGKNWPIIADRIQSGHQPRTPENCRRNFNFVIQKAEELRAAGNTDMGTSYEIPRGQVKPFPWTSEQDAQLHRITQEEIDSIRPRKSNAHSGEPPRPPLIPWKKISKKLDIGANRNHCRTRWMRLVDDPFWHEIPLDQPHFWDGDLDRLVELVAKERPYNSVTWRQFQHTHFPMHRQRLLRDKWSRASVDTIKQSKKLTNQLEMLVLQYGEQMWGRIAKEMTDGGYYCIHRHCQAAWNSQYGHTDIRWSSDELDQLMKAVEEIQHTKSKGKNVNKTTADLSIKDWVRIGKLLPSKTSYVCQSKWAEIKLREIEDAAGVKDVEGVADPRTTSQSSPSSTQGLSAVKKRASWTPENVALLQKTVGKYGASPPVFEYLAQLLGTTHSGCFIRWSSISAGGSSSN